MLSRRTPAAWRKGFALHRRKAGTDRYGDAVAVYDMEHPDVTVADGDENGICWQSVRTWQSGGNLSSGGRVDARRRTGRRHPGRGGVRQLGGGGL